MPYCSGPGMFSEKRPLVQAWHSGQSLISATTFTSSTVYLISRRTRCSRADGSTSERSPPQLSQTSTVVFWRFSPVIEFRSVPRPCRGFFFGGGRSYWSRPCPSAMEGYRNFFWSVWKKSINTAIKSLDRRHNAPITASAFSEILPLIRTKRC